MDEAKIAELIADALDGEPDMTFVDCSDSGEVTIHAGGKVFRAVVVDITAS